MSEQNQIPSEIAEIIERKRIAVLEEQRQSKEAQKRQLEEFQMQGQIKFNEYLQKAVLKVPEWLRPYLDLTGDNQPNYERIAKGWDSLEQHFRLHFSIPGLVEIQFDPKDNQWRAESAYWPRGYDEWDVPEPQHAFTNSSYWRSDLECVLGEAQAQMNEYQGYLESYVAQKEELAKKLKQREQANQERQAQANEAEIQKELKQHEEQAEEQALFNLIKNDPIAIHMLRAFVLIRDERHTFEQRLYEADESMASIEGYWSNKASELRRQAAEAQRRADDERSRLQSDLDDVEAKLVKEQRKHNGW